MLQLLLLTCILAVPVVVGELKIIVPDVVLPAESGRLLSRDELNEGNYYGINTINQNDNMQIAPRYFSQKYNLEDHSNVYQTKGKDDAEHDYPIRLHGYGDFHRRANNMHENHRGMARQNMFMVDAYGPDYHQPTWVLDYRYLKTGGKDYIRALNHQGLIRPKNAHTEEYKAVPNNYGSVLEYLRLRNMAEKGKPQRH